MYFAKMWKAWKRRAGTFADRQPQRSRSQRRRTLFLEPLEDRTLLSVQIQLDYSYDTNGFFTQHPQAKAILQEAVDDLTSQLSTSTPLLAIAPSGSNSWTATPFNPANPTQTLSIPNLSVPQDTLVVFVGGADLPASGELGEGGPGGSQYSGDAAWVSTVQARGQTGFAPWGGTISFDMNPSDNWYFGTSSSVPQGQSDFFSVATHELGHLLGIGTAPQWYNLVQSGTFVGANAEAAYNNKPVPLDQSESQDPNAHWANGDMSTAPDGSAQQAVMDPFLPTGTRDYFTALDYAGLEDLGWQVQSGAPIITANPNSQTVTAGQTATFTAAASGNPAPTVQWQVSTDGGTTWTNLNNGGNVSGATSTTLTLNNVLSSQNGDEYQANFSNGGGSITTTAALLTVQTPPAITSGNSATFTAGKAGSFTVTATGSPTPSLSESGALPSGVAFTANGNGTATLAGTPAAGTEGKYQISFTAHNGVGNDFTQNFTLTVNTPPAPPAPPAPPSPPAPPPPPSPPAPPASPAPPAPPSAPTLNEPPLLAFFESFLVGSETINGDGSVTVSDSFFGIPLIVAQYDSSGNFLDAAIFGMIIPNSFWST